MKRSIKLLCTVSLLSSLLFVSITSFADSISNLKDNDIKMVKTIDESENILNYYKNNSEYFNVYHDGEDTVVTITDSKLDELLQNNGFDISNFIKTEPSFRSEGINTIR